jgi:hypothetical protein
LACFCIDGYQAAVFVVLFADEDAVSLGIIGQVRGVIQGRCIQIGNFPDVAAAGINLGYLRYNSRVVDGSVDLFCFRIVTIG